MFPTLRMPAVWGHFFFSSSHHGRFWRPKTLWEISCGFFLFLKLHLVLNSRIHHFGINTGRNTGGQGEKKWLQEMFEGTGDTLGQMCCNSRRVLCGGLDNYNLIGYNDITKNHNYGNFRVSYHTILQILFLNQTSWYYLMQIFHSRADWIKY